MEPVHPSLCPTSRPSSDDLVLQLNVAGLPLRAPPAAHPPGIHRTCSLADGIKLPLPVKYSLTPLSLVHFRQGVQGCVFLLCVGCSSQLPSTISKIRHLFLSGISSRSLCLLFLVPVQVLWGHLVQGRQVNLQCFWCAIYTPFPVVCCVDPVFKLSRNLQFI